MKERRLALPAHDVMSKHQRRISLLQLHFARPFLGGAVPWLRHDSGGTHAVEARCQGRSPLPCNGCELASSLDNESGVLGGERKEALQRRPKGCSASGPC